MFDLSAATKFVIVDDEYLDAVFVDDEGEVNTFTVASSEHYPMFEKFVEAAALQLKIPVEYETD